MQTLTRDPLSIVISFLSFDDARRLFGLYKLWHSTCQLECLWKHWAIEVFGNVDPQLDSWLPSGWKALMKSLWTHKKLDKWDFNRDPRTAEGVMKFKGWFHRSKERACIYHHHHRTFIKPRHGDVLLTSSYTLDGSKGIKIWHEKLGLMSLEYYDDIQDGVQPGCFSFPDFPLDYYNHVLPCDVNVIRMTPADRKALLMEFEEEDGETIITDLIDPRLPHLTFRPEDSQGTLMTIKRFDDCIYQSELCGETHYFMNVDIRSTTDGPWAMIVLE